MDSRITTDASKRWGTPCLRDTDITVGRVVGLHLAGQSTGGILEAYPDLTADDIDAALEWYLDFGEDGVLPRPLPPGEQHPLIAVDPEIQGGVPTIQGTRVTVDAIIAMWEADGSIDAILEAFPSIGLADVYAAIDYSAEARA